MSVGDAEIPAFIWMYVAFCVVSAVSLILVSDGFAWGLRVAARLPSMLRTIVALALYMLVAAAFVIPLAVLQHFVTPKAGDAVGASMGLTAYLISLVLAFWSFRARHVPGLRELGYFRSRQERV